MSETDTRPPDAGAGMGAAVPIMATVFISFMVIGMALPVLPLHVHDVLGYGPFMVGVAAGGQFVAALVSRIWAGRLADSRGPKTAVLLGLAAAIVSGVLYLISLAFVATPPVAITLLLIGRTLMGGAESLVITGGMTWGLGVVAPNHAAKSISWIGMSMFAAMAAGAPVGSLVYGQWTFTGIAVATLILPLVALLVVAWVKPFVPAPSERAPVSTVLRAVLLPGVGFALSGITFGAVTAFLTLFFSLNGWANGAPAFTVFAVSLIVTRIFIGHLPDRYGGARVAFWCLLVQAVGLAAIGFAQVEWVAIVGAIVGGTGFALVFPGLGIEAVRLAPPESRGLAMGTYNAFLDLTLGVFSPALGLLAGAFGVSAVFIASAAAALAALPIALVLARQHQSPGPRRAD